MRKVYTLFFVLAVSFAGISQGFYNSENELHAPKNFNYQSAGAIKQSIAGPTWVNVNLSVNNAPQNEPSVRISRANPDIVVAAWRDFRLGYTGNNIIRRIGYTYSSDGGTTWAPSQLLPDPNPDHITQSDPVVTSDMEGNFYISSTSRQPVNGYNREMLLYKSTDNGQTFFLHDIAVPGSGEAGEDKEWLFCDPVAGNTTYNQLMMVWRSFGPTYGIRFRKSEEGGGNWSDTKVVSDINSGQGANITTGVDGEIIVVWKLDGIWMDRSLDGGETFGEDVEISSYPWDSYGSFPFLCTDYSNRDTRGNIYMVWADNRQNGDDVWFQRSEDGGETWMQNPIRVNDVSTYDQFWPVVQCDTNGRVFVMYYDDRDFPGLYNTWIAWSDNAGDTWTNARLSDQTFYFNMPNSDVRFGDYIQVDAYAGKVIPVWTDDRTADDNQEIYSAWVDIGTYVKEWERSNTLAVFYPPYPNPFADRTTLTISLQEAGYARLEIVNSLGQALETLYEGYLDSGEHQFQWTNKAGAGIYHGLLTTSRSHTSIRLVGLE